MQLTGLLFLIAYFVGCLGNSDCENETIDLSVNLKGKKLAIKLPGYAEIKSVFFSVEIGDSCSSNYTYTPRVNKNDTLTFELETNLESKSDMVRILSIIETNKQITTKISDYNFNLNGRATTHIIPETVVAKPTTCNDQEVKSIYDEELKCILAESEPNTKEKSCSGSIIFAENFNETKLDKWTHVVYSRLYTDYAEFVAFRKSNENCYVSDNKLHLEATFPSQKSGSFSLENCTYRINQNKSKNPQNDFLCGPYWFGMTRLPPVHSAALNNKGKLNFLYGRIEIRAKMAKGDWLFPYFLLHPVTSDFETKHQEEHIRIAYVRGNAELRDTAENDIGGKTLFGSVLSKLNAESGLYESMVNITLKSGSHYGDDFHNYTIIRHMDRIIFKVDGVTYGMIKDKMIIERLKETKYYIVLGLTAGGRVNFREEYVYQKQNAKFLGSPQALASLYENNINIQWKQPKLEIEHVYVYSTHPDEN